MALYLGDKKVVPIFKSKLATKRIVQNGTYIASNDNADGYSTVVVDVSVNGGIGIPREISPQNVLVLPKSNFSFSLPTDIIGLGPNTLAYAFYDSNYLIDVDLPNITFSRNNGLYYAFSGCTNLTSVDLSGLVTVNNAGLGYTFSRCRGLTSIDLSSITTAGVYGLQGAFAYCDNLASIDLSGLTHIGSFGADVMFNSCKSLTSIDFPSLNELREGALHSAFTGCTNLTNLSFPALKSTSFLYNLHNEFDYMLYGVTGCTVHFPSNLQAVIGSWNSVMRGFEGMNTTVLFDLAATT